MGESIRHPELFDGRVNAIHKCLQTYLSMTANMLPGWYIYNVKDSCGRKGYEVSVEELCKYFVLYKPEWKGRAVIQDGKNFIML